MALQWLERPPFPILVGDDPPRANGFCGCVLRPWRTASHPFSQHGNLRAGQLFAFRRHLQIFVAVADCLDEQTFLGITRSNRGAGIATGEKPVRRIEDEAALDLLRRMAVTFKTVLREEWLNRFLEQLR